MSAHSGSRSPFNANSRGEVQQVHGAMRSVVQKCTELLNSHFRCLQQYRTLLYEPERTANIVAACAVSHKLRLSEDNVDDIDESDDDSSSSNSSEFECNGEPIKHSLPRNRGSRLNFPRDWAVRDRVISTFGTSRPQPMCYLRIVRQHFWHQ
ncbi:hypothetical protein HPB49_006594 [Dermacentor silvarum]|uniref:Uncharacterized protein n=1 Tax=Dermacentor silvarum TaxID=543639 RepID=A0ACB8DNG9_DERSI|nr:hypothetical protein HPB49_006594 [Dermacentor silvarum]